MCGHRHPLWDRAIEITDWWRANPVSIRALAERYGCGRDTINQILHASMPTDEIQRLRVVRRGGPTGRRLRCPRCGGGKKAESLTCRGCYAADREAA